MIRDGIKYIILMLNKIGLRLGIGAKGELSCINSVMLMLVMIVVSY